MRTIEVEYVPGDRVVGTSAGLAGTVRTVMASEGQRCYLVVADTGTVLGWLEAHEIEPLTINGQEVAP
jgi:hypothetical protein